MSRISLNCSSYVAAQAGHHPDREWGESVDAVNAYYQPVETFAARFQVMLADVKALGFDAVDIWTAGQLNWEWATPEHLNAATNLLQHHNIAVTSLGGAFGVTREEFLSACRMAQALGTDLLSGTTELLASDRDFVVATLQEYNLRLGIENHPERNAAEMLVQIGDGANGRIGTTIDTGWYATQQYDVVQAVEELFPHIFHIHLKDVLHPGDNLSHVNCGYGNGIVPLEAVVRTLTRLGFSGDYSVENHCLDHDPAQELVAGHEMLINWLKN
jgi:sugar phosphate isomerase/epimerase